jgi:DNA-binding XRE family transcriptional regulator
MTPTEPRPGFVGTEAAAERLRRLSARPGAAERVAAIREGMAAADRQYAQSLAEIRKAADLTQTDVAEAMGISQSDISRLERRGDMMLSTLASYLLRVGERPRVVVTVNGEDVELDLVGRPPQPADVSHSV